MKSPQHHQHGRESLFGLLLEPGDIVEASDQYDSTSGTWQDFPAPGCVVQAGASGARIVTRELAWARINGEWEPTLVLDGIPVVLEIHAQIGVGPLIEEWGGKLSAPIHGVVLTVDAEPPGTTWEDDNPVCPTCLAPDGQCGPDCPRPECPKNGEK